MDTSATDPMYNEPQSQVLQMKVTRISRIAWVVAAAFSVILVLLMSCVIYLFLRDSSTDDAIRIRDMAVKEIKGDLERYALAYWLQLEEDERHLTMLMALKNESNMLKVQLAESAAREDLMNRTVSTVITELAALKFAVLDEQRKEESLNRTFSAIINELLALKVTIPEDQRMTMRTTSSSTSLRRNPVNIIGALCIVLIPCSLYSNLQ